MVARYVVGSNIPGYSPDEDPRGPFEWAEAVADMKADMESFLDDLFSGSDQEPEYLTYLEERLKTVLWDAEDGVPREHLDVLFEGRNFYVYQEA